MATLSAAKLVRSLMNVTGQGTNMFSDKTTFGRSIKVWNAPDTFYHTAQKVLTQHGYTTKLVKTKPGNRLRLHVYA
jgi:hypothetical protein